jgi:hypothetical protein
MWRYVRAFFKALAMTIRGEKPLSPAERLYPRLFDWLREGQQRVEAVYTAADGAGLGLAQRNALQVTIDGRQHSLETLLGGVRYHLAQEYPYMLQNLTEHTLTGIYASNLNDQYWVTTLATAEGVPSSVQQALNALAQHLSAIPPSNDLGASEQKTQ